jgi:hypothetical protein
MRLRAFLTAAAAIAAGVALATVAGTPANAASCSTNTQAGWYVNPDETALQPTWTPAGLLLDGPSLIHHAVTGAVLLADLKPGAFTDTGLQGVRPLLKYETAAPYSTVNQVTSGVDSFWSSKLAVTADGGQDHPEPIAVLAGLAPYTPTTTVATFGVGYATDSGNKDTVTAVTFGGDTYAFVPCPPAGPTGGTGTGGSTGGGTTAGHSTATSGTHTQAGTAGGTTRTGGQVQAAVIPSTSPSDLTSSTASASPEYFTDPSLSVAPVVPQQGPTAQASHNTSLAGPLIGTGVVVLVAAGVLSLWFGRRRSHKPPKDLDVTAILKRTGGEQQ